MSRVVHPTRGFVLVNALVLVAAFAAAAVVLLGRAETGRQRQAGAQQAEQAALYLDAAEALVIAVLAADRQGGAVDGPGDAWAATLPEMTLDRGRASLAIVDLQGRFNVNWLANPEDALARDGFDRLVQRLALAPRVATAIIGFVAPGGPADPRPYARPEGSVPGIRPVGGPVLTVRQLQAIPNLRPRDLAVLEPYIAALPGDMVLNVNTAPTAVLASLLPGESAEGLARLEERRRRAPFVSIEEFAGWLPAGSEPDETRFGVGSAWFRADIAVQIEGRTVKRRTVFERPPSPHAVRAAYRVEDWNWQ